MIIHPLIGVSGSRYAKGKRGRVEDALSGALHELIPEQPILTVGDCPTGVDLYARELYDRWEKGRFWRREIYGAEWTRWGNPAGPLRNAAMIERAYVQQAAGAKVIILAFPERTSIGTINFLKLARAAKLKDIRVEEL